MVDRIGRKQVNLMGTGMDMYGQVIFIWRLLRLLMPFVAKTLDDRVVVNVKGKQGESHPD